MGFVWVHSSRASIPDGDARQPPGTVQWVLLPFAAQFECSGNMAIKNSVVFFCVAAFFDRAERELQCVIMGSFCAAFS